MTFIEAFWVPFAVAVALTYATCPDIGQGFYFYLKQGGTRHPAEMGGNSSTTRKVSFGLDEDEKVTVIEGVKVRALLLRRAYVG